MAIRICSPIRRSERAATGNGEGESMPTPPSRTVSEPLVRYSKHRGRNIGGRGFICHCGGERRHPSTKPKRRAFVSDLAIRLRNRVQITTDGHKAYLEAMEGVFGCDVDYAMLIKVFG